jgi:hypothetical protein
VRGAGHVTELNVLVEAFLEGLLFKWAKQGGGAEDVARGGCVAKLECCFDALVSYKLMGRKPLYITAGRGVTDPLTGAGFSVTGCD